MSALTGDQVRKSDGPFVIRISRDGKPDRYLSGVVGAMEFPSMQSALLRVKGIKREFRAGEYAAVVPLEYATVDR